MQFSRWSLLQIIILCFLTGFMVFTEVFSSNEHVVSTPGRVDGLGPLLFTWLVLSCFYLIFLLEAKKENEFFNHPLWGKAPVLIIAFSLVSLTVFMLAFFWIPLFDLVQEWRLLIYVFVCYFLFLFFIFIFAMVHKNSSEGQQHEKTIHLSLLWSVGVLSIAVFFITPPL